MDQLRRIPTPLAILIGLLCGILLPRSISWNSSPPAWRGSAGPSQQSLSSRHIVALPSIEQRARVLELLTSLSPHYTKECTRHSQPLYASQARDRYSTLLGYDAPSRSSWLGGLGFSPLSEETMPMNIQNVRRDLSGDSHKYFFAINLYNSFDIIPDLFATLFRVAAVLGYHNVYVSIYENGSTDQTKALLRIFDALTRSVGMRVTIRTSMRTRGAFNHRIEYLAEVRNAAFGPLYELRDAHNEVFDSIIFMNDILPCMDDILELIWQSRKNNAGITCAADYMYHDEIGAPVFYDNWVARDINGTALENAPFESVFHDPQSSDRFQRHLPIQVQSCWNGIAVLDPEPFYSPPHVKFRMARITEGECSASECSLICNDYWDAGYGRILMVPRVKLAYDSKVFDIIHPARRNLTAIRGYVRLGGLPDDPRTDPQDRSWFGPHDRLFVEEEGNPVDFVPGPEHVWCWGWDGAGDLDGPDVDPIWERRTNRSTRAEAVDIKHNRNLRLDL
ncbi:glycosyltransferase family 69 protein [Neolentinus lepideus HHB14362 ss-1]|uniref:Glycosyltransferase family 69 protein n=1 Tax=Neolentinus lepideus HHB14362 ss-1 TaxID=1314782 RepID=A0A165T392_9AGAM|nr:glycosyltransferase family 69 protein [Neolentinus lepideus HHB14362 ss-1]